MKSVNDAGTNEKEVVTAGWRYSHTHTQHFVVLGTGEIAFQLVEEGGPPLVICDSGTEVGNQVQFEQVCKRITQDPEKMEKLEKVARAHKDGSVTPKWGLPPDYPNIYV